jgi:uncharacterized repeat protein (TIGR02543 family)
MYVTVQTAAQEWGWQESSNRENRVAQGPPEAARQGLKAQGESYVRRLTILLATVGALLLVPAAQALANGTMKVNIVGTGSGTVDSTTGASESGFLKGNPPINCSYNGVSTSGICNDELSVEEEVEGIGLRQTAASGSAFVKWVVNKGGTILNQFCSDPKTGEPFRSHYCTLFSAEGEETAMEVTAEFAKAFPLKVEKTGEGTVVSNPAGIECGVKCEAEVPEGTVTLTASPATGYAFSAWAGCTEHVGLTCKVLMDKAKTVKVTFVKTPLLTIFKAGSGQGKVGATGISCDENCSGAASAIKTGTLVTVKVAPAKGSENAVFEGGTGSASGCSGESCTFTISEDSSVKVKFDPKPTKTLTVNLTGPAAYKGKVSGKGTVKGLTGSAINCGAGCTTQTESFFAGDTVTLTAAAGTGYTFAGWKGEEAGTCTGTTNPCTITTSANKTLSAEFK